MCFHLPDVFAMTVALNSDIGLVCGLTKSCHTSADILLNPDDNVLK